MAITVQQFSNLVGSVNDAVSSPTRWDNVVGEIVAAFGAIRGFVAIAEPATSRIVVRSCDAEIRTEEFRRRIDRATEWVQRLPIGTVLTSDELSISQAQWDSTCLRHSAAPNGPDNSVVARLSGGVPASWICLAMPEHFDSSEPDCLALLRALVPHLVQALRMQSKLVELGRERAFALGTLEKAQHGVMIVSADAELMFANTMAEDIARRVDGLAVHPGGRLGATYSGPNRSLGRLIRRAIGPPPSDGSIAIPRSSGHPLAVHVTTLDGMGDGLPWHRAALLLVVDPDHDPDPSPTALRQLYGLTEAETAVATAVVRGDGLQAVADQLSVSPYTARTHLQHIFTKTGTHRQAELVRLLLLTVTAI